MYYYYYYYLKIDRFCMRVKVLFRKFRGLQKSKIQGIGGNIQLGRI